MSKRSRKSDNSKRQQPIQQQRAQARQPGGNGPSRSDGAQQPSKSSAGTRTDGSRSASSSKS